MCCLLCCLLSISACLLCLLNLLVDLLFILLVGNHCEIELDSVMIILEVAIIVIVCQLLPAIVIATYLYTINQLMCTYIIQEFVTGWAENE